MKLREYAKKHGICYRTAWNRYHAGKIPNAFMDESGHIFVPTNNLNAPLNHVAIYARVSSSQNKSNLEYQAQRLLEYATAKGYTVVSIVKEVGSGVNDNRRELLKLLSQENWGTLLIEHKDRLTRVGFNYLDVFLSKTGKRIEVVNMAEDNKEDLMQDFVAMVTSFCARIYGLRRTRRQTEKLIESLNKHE